MLKNINNWGENDSIANKVFTLHVTDIGAIPSTPYSMAPKPNQIKQNKISRK